MVYDPNSDVVPKSANLLERNIVSIYRRDEKSMK